MSCQTCGRGDGHWLGCEKAQKPVRHEPVTEPEKIVKVEHCEHGECSNPKRPQTKGPKPKYCDDHSTPKSRKE